MSANRAIPRGKVYRQLFDAQAQLSRSLLAGRRVQRTDSLSPVDSKTPDSIRWHQRSDDVDGSADVIRLPDRLVVDGSSSGMIDKLMKRRKKNHDEALRQQEAELHHLSQVCELEVRSICEQLLSSLTEVDLRLDILKDRIGQKPLSLQDLHNLWMEADGEIRQKKTHISEMQQKLKNCDDGRSLEIKRIVKKHLQLLQQISFLSVPDVQRLIHTKAMMLNQALLANRRSSARLVLLLLDRILQQELQLRLHWEDSLDRWRDGRVEDMRAELRTMCSSRVEKRDQFSDQTLQNQEVLVQQQTEIIYKICSLVPPTSSTALVSNWLNELTAINQQIDGLHDDMRQQLQRFYEDTWLHRRVEAQRCREALALLQLSDQQLEDIMSSQLLPLIEQSQRDDEEQLAGLDVGHTNLSSVRPLSVHLSVLCLSTCLSSDCPLSVPYLSPICPLSVPCLSTCPSSVCPILVLYVSSICPLSVPCLSTCPQESRDLLDQHVLEVSRLVFEVMRGVALLWDTHCRRAKRREEDLEAKLQQLKKERREQLERLMGPVENMLVTLRQESRRDFLDQCLEQVLEQLKDVQDSVRHCLPQQCDVLDQLPVVLVEELYTYSNAVSSFFRLWHRNRPSIADMRSISASSTRSELSQGSSSEPDMVQPRSDSISREAGFSFGTLKLLTEVQLIGCSAQ